MNPSLQGALAFARAAADNAITGVETKLPQLTDDELRHLEDVVAPAFHVPDYIIAMAKSQNAAIEKILEPIEKSALELLRARIDATLPAAA